MNFCVTYLKNLLIIAGILFYSQYIHAEEFGKTFFEQSKTLSETDYALLQRLSNAWLRKFESDPGYIERYSRSDLLISKLSFIGTVQWLCNPAYTDLILPYFTDTDPRVRLKAMQALGSTGNPKYEPLLYLFANLSNSSEEASALLKALGGFSSNKTADTVASFLYRRMPGQPLWPLATEQLGRIGTCRAAEHLIKFYRLTQEYEKFNVINSLGSIRNCALAHEFVFDLLHEPNTTYTADLLVTLGRMESYDHIQFIVNQIDNDSANLPEAAIEALGYVGSIDHITYLLECLNTYPQAEDTIFSAIETILTTYSKDDIIAYMLSTDHPGSIALQIAELNDASSIEVLEEMLHTPDPLNRLAALFALDQMTLPQAHEALERNSERLDPLTAFHCIPIILRWQEMQVIDSEKFVSLTGLKGESSTLGRLLTLMLTPSAPGSLPTLRQYVNTEYAWTAAYGARFFEPQSCIIRDLQRLLTRGSHAERFYSVETLLHFAEQDPTLLKILRVHGSREKSPRIKQLLENL